MTRADILCHIEWFTTSRSQWIKSHTPLPPPNSICYRGNLLKSSQGTFKPFTVAHTVAHVHNMCALTHNDTHSTLTHTFSTYKAHISHCKTITKKTHLYTWCTMYMYKSHCSRQTRTWLTTIHFHFVQDKNLIRGTWTSAKSNYARGNHLKFFFFFYLDTRTFSFS